MTSTLHPVSYSLSSETFKSNFTKGFSLLQQNFPREHDEVFPRELLRCFYGVKNPNPFSRFTVIEKQTTFAFIILQQEFVDVTIATDGHFVKAHQNILALASPYLKGILQSAPCQHPIIFLCNVTHDILSYILEFVYTGEVQVPSNMYPAFINAAQQMHIKGLENLNAVMNVRALNDEENVREVRKDFVTQDVFSDFIMKDGTNLAAPLKMSNNAGIDKRLTENLSIHEDNGNINNTTECDLNNTEYENTVIDIEDTSHQPSGARTETSVNHVGACHFINGSTDDDLSNTQNERTVIDIADTFYQHQPSEAATETSVNHVLALELVGSSTEALIEQDDISHNDASSQLSCSNSHSAESHDQSISQDKNHKRRWRCIEYRQKKCFAYVDTLHEKIIGRLHNHTHGFHDEKIISVGSKKNVFTSLKHATK